MKALIMSTKAVSNKHYQPISSGIRPGVLPITILFVLNTNWVVSGFSTLQYVKKEEKESLLEMKIILCRGHDV